MLTIILLRSMMYNIGTNVAHQIVSQSSLPARVVINETFTPPIPPSVGGIQNDTVDSYSDSYTAPKGGSY